MANFFYDGGGSYPSNGVFYPNQYLRPQNIVVGPTGYQYYTGPGSNLASTYTTGGTGLYFKDSSGVSHTLFTGATGGVPADGTFILQTPDANLMNAQALSQLMGNTGDVLGIANPVSGTIVQVTNVYDTGGNTGPSMNTNFQLGFGGGNLPNVDTTCARNISIGFGNIPEITTQFSDNILIGQGIIQSSEGYSATNVFIGNQSCGQITSGTDSVTLGYNTASQAPGIVESVVIGSQCEGHTGSTGPIYGTVNVGYGSSSNSNNYSTMLGTSNLCLDSNSANVTIVGNFNDVTSSANLNLIGGSNGVTGSADSYVIGNLNLIGNCTDCCIFGNGNTVNNLEDSFFIGSNSQPTNSNLINRAVSIGCNQNGNLGSDVVLIGDSIICGGNTGASSDYSVCIGAGCLTNNIAAICIGIEAYATGFCGISIGPATTTGGETASYGSTGNTGSIAIGAFAEAIPGYSSAYGWEAIVNNPCTFNFAIDATDGVSGGQPVCLSVNNSYGGPYSLCLDGNTGATGSYSTPIVPGLSMYQAPDTSIPTLPTNQLGLYYSQTQSNLIAQIGMTGYPLIQSGGGSIQEDFYYDNTGFDIPWGENVTAGSAGANNYGNVTYNSGDATYTINKTGIYEIIFNVLIFFQSDYGEANFILFLVNNITDPATVLTSFNIGQFSNYQSMLGTGNYCGLCTEGDTISMLNLSSYNSTSYEYIYSPTYTGLPPYESLGGYGATISFKYLSPA